MLDALDSPAGGFVEAHEVWISGDTEVPYQVPADSPSSVDGLEGLEWAGLDQMGEGAGMPGFTTAEWWRP